MRSSFSKLLSLAGIELNGSRSFDIRVHDERLYKRVFADGSLGLGEAYLEGWWDCDDLSQFFFLICRSGINDKILPWQCLVHGAMARVFNLQSKRRAHHVGEYHYDIGNDLYQSMLDRNMIYTCGYWKNSANLEEAQNAKLDLVCKKLGLKPGMRLLDIGCGWGGLLKFAAENYGVSAVGVTISKEQVELGQSLCSGLDVEIRLQDYRDLNDTFDRIVSLGMFEHVGLKNYRIYLETVAKNLTPDGLFLLHTIGGNQSENMTDPWINKYIFPNGEIPSIAQIGSAMEKLFVMEDWHNFGADYDKTLLAWYENFQKNWHALESHFDPVFYRRWKYYLLSCAGSFRARNVQLWQLVLSKPGMVESYASVR